MHLTTFRSEKTRALMLGEIQVMLDVRLLTGYKTIFEGGTVRLEKTWSTAITQFPLQVCIRNVDVAPDTLLQETMLLKDYFRPGSAVCYLGKVNYGALGTVTEVQDTALNFVLQVRTHPFISTQLLVDSQQWMAMGQAAAMLQVNNTVLSKVTGSIYVRGTKGMNVCVCLFICVCVIV